MAGRRRHWCFLGLLSYIPHLHCARPPTPPPAENTALFAAANKDLK